MISNYHTIVVRIAQFILQITTVVKCAFVQHL